MFSTIISSNIFCALISFRDSSDTNVRPFDIAPQVPKALYFFFFSSIFCWLFWLDNSYWSIFKFTDFPVSILTSDFFFKSYSFSILKFLLLVFCSVYFFAEDVYLLSISRVFTFPWSIVIKAILKASLLPTLESFSVLAPVVVPCELLVFYWFYWVLFIFFYIAFWRFSVLCCETGFC